MSETIDVEVTGSPSDFPIKVGRLTIDENPGEDKEETIYLSYAKRKGSGWKISYIEHRIIDGEERTLTAFKLQK